MPLFGSNSTTEQEARRNNVFLVYSGPSHVTGNRLGDYLGVDHGRSNDSRLQEEDYDYLIRWGCHGHVGGASRSAEEIQPADAIQSNTDKFNSLEVMDRAGIPVPEYERSFDALLRHDDVSYPVLGREFSHTRGTDINLILQERDDFLTTNDFFVNYIPTEYEYRVHIFDGEVFKIHQKLLRHEADNHPYIRNSENGWVFVGQRDEVDTEPAVEAVEALDLDYGAVDLIKEEGTGDSYVLEVNTAPSLDEPNLRRYGDQFASEADIPQSQLDMSRVEWDDEEEEN